MFLYVLLAFLAAFGLFSVVWACLGWLLPACREGWLLYPGAPGKLAFVYIYLWLRGMGIVRCPLIVADLGLSDSEKIWLNQKDITLYSPWELPVQLGLGVDAT